MRRQGPETDEFAIGVAAGLAGTAMFAPTTIEHVDWFDELDGRQFVDRVDSHSTHRLLDHDARHRLRDALLDVLGETSRLQVAYTTEVFPARRRS